MWKYICYIISVIAIILCFRDATIAFQINILWLFWVNAVLGVLLIKEVKD